jgi:hypothetical protein
VLGLLEPNGKMEYCEAQRGPYGQGPDEINPIHGIPVGASDPAAPLPSIWLPLLFLRKTDVGIRSLLKLQLSASVYLSAVVSDIAPKYNSCRGWEVGTDPSLVVWTKESPSGSQRPR